MPTLPFSEYYVDQAPEARGVYCLFDSGLLIKVGHTLKATHFTWKVTGYSSTTEEELLAAHKARFGQLPHCNDRVR